MTVKRGEEWGTPAGAPQGAVHVETDAALAKAISGGRPVVVRGGDVHRAVGAPAGESVSRRLPIDVIRVNADGIEAIAVAHVVVRRRGLLGWWRGPVVAVMNVDHFGVADVAPRAHPNDGWLDVVTVRATMPVRARWQAWRRLPTGTHLPHPDISVRRTREEVLTFDRPAGLWIDGVDHGVVRVAAVHIDPDAATIHV